jgi:FkbH-like protein
VKAQLQRDRARADVTDEAAFLASLEIVSTIEALSPGPKLARVQELFQRTTQFNTNGFKPSVETLAALAIGADSGVLILSVRDRFGDHGLVGAIAYSGADILGFVLSCRVIGLGVEQGLVEAALSRMRAAGHGLASATIIATDRNSPSRHLYADMGFTAEADGRWIKVL